MKEVSENYVKCATVCFDSCVHNMTARNLSDQEISCITKCAEKFSKMNQRLLMRFQELNQQEAEKQMQQAQK